MRILDQLAIGHGRLSDVRAVWWPFVFLKPVSPERPITWRRMLIMVPCFAAWFLIVWLLKEWMVRDTKIPPLGELAKVYGYFLLGFLIWFNVVTAPLWNHRSRILNQPKCK